FFSSRRRHTRWPRDWSSDVCSSDLGPVKSRAGRWLGWLLALVGVGLALKFFAGFPWQVTFAALLGADRWLLVVGLAVNLSSLVAKGWGWHLILKPVAPHSWRVAQEANLVGAAVNDLSVAVAGEAARVHLIVQRGGGPARSEERRGGRLGWWGGAVC